MKKTKEILAFLMTFMLCVSMLVMPVSAASANQDGIEVSLMTDKEAYSQSEQIKATLTVTNTNDIAVNNVRLKNVVPNGYVLADGSEAEKQVETLGAGETVTLIVTYVSNEDDGKDNITGDGSGNNNSTDGSNDNSANDSTGKENVLSDSNVQTGDDTNIVVWVMVLVVAVATAVVILIVKKKKGKRILSLFLCLTMAGAIIPVSGLKAEAAEEQTKTITVSTMVLVNGDDMEISSIIQYDALEGEITDNPDDEIEDSDGDSVPNYIEEAFGADIDKEDTDEDGLTDYEEIYITGTDPILEDSDEDGVTDDKEDIDEDGLSNADEVAVGTNPLRKDTDGDGLADGEEINQYGTDPILYDTDSDGVSDGDEVRRFNTDPLTAQESFYVTDSCQDEGDTVTANVALNLSGDQVDTLTIDPVEDKNFFSEEMPGYMGKAYNFSVDGSFDSATISFEFDTSLLGETGVPAIFYFNEEEQTLEELETTVTGNIASAVTNHFSTYILLNRTLYYDSFTWEDVWEDSEGYDGVEVILVIDDSGSMDSNDANYQRLSVAQDLVDNLPEDSMIGVVKFASSVNILTTELTDNKDLAKSYLTTDYFQSSGGTYMYRAINEAFDLYQNVEGNVLKTMVVLSDGASSGTSSHSSTITLAQDSNIRIYTVGLGGSSSSYFTRYLQPLATETGGTFYLAADADQLSSIYADINKRIDLETDTDGDTIPDYYEDNMISFNGMKVELDKTNADTDGDGLMDNEEVEVQLIYNEDQSKVYVKGKILSIPTIADSDYDGIPDNEDPDKLSGTFTGDLIGYYDVSDAEYTMDYRDFFSSSDSYDSDLSSASLIFANTIYNDCGFQYDINGSSISDISNLMQYHGFKDVVDYKLADGFSDSGLSVEAYADDDISEVAVGYYDISYGGETKTILGVIIRGTNGSIEEWSSNFDMGDPDEWDSEYHKGFYTTEERIRSFINLYVNTKLASTDNLVYWVTGHSRGAALANILSANLIDEGKEVYSYTFATPTTTISKSVNDEKYNSIFNFVNTSDFVTYVPLKQWGFDRFGITIDLNLEGTPLESTWCDKTGNSNYNALNESVITLATNRIVKSCSSTWSEVFDRAGEQNINDEQFRYITDRARRFCDIEERTSIFGNHNGYKLYPSTAFVFQLGAELLAGNDQEKNNAWELIKELWNSKYGAMLVLFLGDAITNWGSFSDISISDPFTLIGDGHAPATYYVLTQE